MQTREQRIQQRQARLRIIFGDLLADGYGGMSDACDYLALCVAMEVEVGRD